MLLQELILELVKNGIEVTLEWDKTREVVIHNLNTGMKSHCHLVEIDGKIIAEMRYDKSSVVEDYDEILWIVKNCMCGRDYLSGNWLTLLLKEGVIKANTTTQTNYS